MAGAMATGDQQNTGKLQGGSANLTNAGKGRKKGVPNKLTRTIKAAVELAFEKAGGADYLARMAEQEPTSFMTLLGKVIPQQIEHSVNNDLAERMIRYRERPGG